MMRQTTRERKWQIMRAFIVGDRGEAAREKGKWGMVWSPGPIRLI
jgi:hypothetical protein